MDEQLQEMAVWAKNANLQALFQVVKGIALPESTPTSDAWRVAPSQLPEFLDMCVTESKAQSAETFVLGPDLGKVATKSPMLLATEDRDELSKWFGFYGRAFGLRRYIDDPHPQTELKKNTGELVNEIAGFVIWRFRAHGVPRPF